MRFGNVSVLLLLLLSVGVHDVIKDPIAMMHRVRFCKELFAPKKQTPTNFNNCVCTNDMHDHRQQTYITDHLHSTTLRVSCLQLMLHHTYPVPVMMDGMYVLSTACVCVVCAPRMDA